MIFLSNFKILQSSSFDPFGSIWTLKQAIDGRLVFEWILKIRACVSFPKAKQLRRSKWLGSWSWPRESKSLRFRYCSKSPAVLQDYLKGDNVINKELELSLQPKSQRMHKGFINFDRFSILYMRFYNFNNAHVDCLLTERRVHFSCSWRVFY